MSLLCLNRSRTTLLRAGVAVVGILGVSAPALAAQFYIQPEADLNVEVNSNRRLITQSGPQAGKVTSEGYGGEVGATLGYNTPVSETAFRGRFGYQDFPKDEDHELQGTAELSTQYRWLTSTLDLTGRFDRVNTISSELANPLFNPLVPTNNTTPETGRIRTATTRTLTDLSPRFSHKFTERLSAGAAATFEETYYSGQSAADYVSYVYGQAQAFVDYAVTPRLDVSVGPYFSRDLAREGEAAVTGTGGKLDFKYKFSKTFAERLELSGESDENTVANDSGPGTKKVRTNGFGATYATTWTGQISSLDLSIGRQLTPSGSGGEYYADQIQVEYRRSLTQRFEAMAAARAIRYSASVSQAQNAPYKYVDATLALKWLATRTFFINGGVEFVRVDYGSNAVSQAAVNNGTAVAAVDSGKANNFRAFIGFGYLGLGPKSALTYPY